MATVWSAAVALGVSSASVASISASSLIVSCGGAVSRSASSRSPGSGPMPCGTSVRVSVSGLYWNETTFSSRPETGFEQDQPAAGQPGRVGEGR